MTQRSSAKTIRRIEKATGHQVAHATGDLNVQSFIVLDPGHPDGHWHGWYDRRPGRWGRLEDPRHSETCSELLEDG